MVEDQLIWQFFPEQKRILACSARESYRAGGIRTRGLLHPRQALYQAEPQPELIAASEINAARASISLIPVAVARSNK